jgi:hypothetical protein
LQTRSVDTCTVNYRARARDSNSTHPPPVLQLALYAGVVAIALSAAGCSSRADGRKQITPVYDQTGKLSLLKYDADGNGKIDTWSYMDGARVVRIEIDKDEDGKIERWEYYSGDQKLEKVGFSRSNDGKEDAWSFAAADGSVGRIEVSTHRDGKVNRIEHYDHDVLVRADEDTDGDGKPDKWESYEGSRLASVSFDTLHRGTPDRRMTYGKDGTVVVEVDPHGDGHFVRGDVVTASRSR